MERTIVIGDIHGCYHTLSDLLKECEATKKDRYIFIGDYIDRGPFSMHVVERLLVAQQELGDKRVVLLRGNHEQFAIDKNGRLDFLWEANGGLETMRSYKDHNMILTNHIKAFKKMPVYLDDGEYIFVHAGLKHPNLRDNSEKEMLWDRDWLKDTIPQRREKPVIFGHTPMKDAPCYMPTGDIGIDGGCVFGGNLCAVVIEHETGRLRFFSVPQNEKDKQ